MKKNRTLQRCNFFDLQKHEIHVTNNFRIGDLLTEMNDKLSFEK